MPAAGKDRALAFKFYLWNCMLCESFHLPLHFAEIVCRNAFHEALTKRVNEYWYNDATFRTLLDRRFLDELNGALVQEGNQHGDAMTSNHVVSALTFGFWEHLCTKRFERYLWAKGVKNIFPNASNAVTQLHIHGQIETVRRWRNRIAHHRAIFDKGPMRKYTDTLTLIEWVCSDTRNWVASVSTIPQVIALRPK
jgi:hypothetical protein